MTREIALICTALALWGLAGLAAWCGIRTKDDEVRDSCAGAMIGLALLGSLILSVLLCQYIAHLPSAFAEVAR